MRLRPLTTEVRVFMSQSEYGVYLDYCDERLELIVRIEGETSTRIGTVAGLTRNQFFVPTDKDVNIAFVRLERTKDTTEGENALGGAWRLSWVPMPLYNKIERYCEKHNIGPDEEIFDIGKRHMMDLIKEKSLEVAQKTSVDEYKHVRSHDFRAFYATQMIRRKGVNMDIVMEMGGWKNRKSLDPYLATPLEKDIQDSLARAGALEIDLPLSLRSDGESEVIKRLRAIENALRVDKSPVDIAELTKSQVEAVIREAKKKDSDESTSYNLTIDNFESDDRASTDRDPALSRLVLRLLEERDAIVNNGGVVTPARIMGIVGLSACMLFTLWAIGGQFEAMAAGELGTSIGGVLGILFSALWLPWAVHEDFDDGRVESRFDELVARYHAAVDPVFRPYTEFVDRTLSPR